MSSITSTNVKLNTALINISPKSYLKNIVFESIKDKLQKKRKKIPSDDFEIPEIKDFDYLLTKGYNVKQLKDICKFYPEIEFIHIYISNFNGSIPEEIMHDCKSLETLIVERTNISNLIPKSISVRSFLPDNINEINFP